MHFFRIILRRFRREPLSTAATLLLFLVASFGATLLLVVSLTVLNHPLSFPLPPNAVIVWGQNPNLQLDKDNLPISVPTFLAIRDEVSDFDELHLTRDFDATAGEPGAISQVNGVYLTPGFLTMLGVVPIAGRVFAASDSDEGAERVAIISHAIASQRFQNPSAALGELIPIDDAPHRIVGVMPPAFSFPSQKENIDWSGATTDIWVPLRLNDAARADYGNMSYVAFGVLRQGASIAGVHRRLDALYRKLEADVPEAYKNWSSHVVKLHEQVLGKLTPILLTLAVGGVVIILIGWVNYTLITWTRAFKRSGEFALRKALGATRRNIIALLVIEDLVLAAGSTLMGVGLAFLALPLVQEIIGGGIQTMGQLEWSFSSFALAMLGALVVTAIVASLPALFIPDTDLATLIKGNSALRLKGSSDKPRTALVTFQVGLGVSLVFSSIFLGLALRRATQTNLGFHPSGVLAAPLALPANALASAGERYQALDAIAAKLETNSAYEGFAFAEAPPFVARPSYRSFEVEGVGLQRGEPIVSLADVVSPHYFDVLSIGLLDGRAFDEGDVAGSERVAIVSEELKNRFFPSSSAVDQRIRFRDQDDDEDAWIRIVGVVSDIVHNQDARGVRLQIYTPLAQSEVGRIYGVASGVSGAEREPALLSFEDDLRAANRLVPVGDAQSLARALRDSFSQSRLTVLSIGLFSVAAMLLCSLGLFSVISNYTLDKRNEFSIRMALGATPLRNLALLGRFLAIMMVGGLLFAALVTPAVIGTLTWSDDLEWGAFMAPAWMTLALTFALFVLSSLTNGLNIVRMSPAVHLKQE